MTDRIDFSSQAQAEAAFVNFAQFTTPERPQTWYQGLIKAISSLQDMFLIQKYPMGKVTATITVSNQIDQTLAERGFIQPDEVRTVTLHDVLVDTGATRLCLPTPIISQLGLTIQGEADVKTATGVEKVRIFKAVTLTIAGREGIFNCIELPADSDPLIGVIPLEDLGLEPDLQNQRLRLLPMEGKETYLTVM